MCQLTFVSGAFGCRDLTAQKQLEHRSTSKRRYLLLCSFFFFFFRPSILSASPAPILKSSEFSTEIPEHLLRTSGKSNLLPSPNLAYFLVSLGNWSRLLPLQQLFCFSRAPWVAHRRKCWLIRIMFNSKRVEILMCWPKEIATICKSTALLEVPMLVD